jgi:hypothetical protein
MLRAISPIIGYSILCLAMVAVYLADLVQEERAQRRRVASLAPRPPVPALPMVWIVVAALSTLMLLPYALSGVERVAAALTGVCALAMAAIALRVASAPTQLVGCDPQTESIKEHSSRAVRAGLACVLAVGIVFVFTGFVNDTLPAVTPFERALNSASFFLWLSLLICVAWYVLRVSRPHPAATQ